MLLWLTVAVLAILPAVSLAQEGLQEGGAKQASKAAEDAQPASICATGSARVPIVSDHAVLTLCMRKNAKSVEAAQLAADAALAALHDALLSIEGVTSADIHTEYNGVKTLYHYQYGKLGQQETPAGFQVSAHLAVTVKNKALLGRVLDTAIQNGAENSYRLAFQSSQTSAAYDTALAQATAEAVRKVQLLAQAAGLTLGKLQSVTELSSLSEQSEAVSGGAQSGDAVVNVEIEQAEVPLDSALSVEAVVRVCYAAE
ncbi:MAG: SIMPL domain-containing protein [Clostridia bacterium]